MSQRLLQHWPSPVHSSPDDLHCGLGPQEHPAPPLHAAPAVSTHVALQQFASVVQAWPSGLQLPSGTQKPVASQVDPAQQGLLALQASPWSLQLADTHVSLTQLSVQHSPATVHAVPSVLQTMAPQLPVAVSQLSVQQSVLSTHA
jgi:hypothetical protein